MVDRETVFNMIILSFFALDVFKAKNEGSNEDMLSIRFNINYNIFPVSFLYVSNYTLDMDHKLDDFRFFGEYLI